MRHCARVGGVRAILCMPNLGIDWGFLTSVLNWRSVSANGESVLLAPAVVPKIVIDARAC